MLRRAALAAVATALLAVAGPAAAQQATVTGSYDPSAWGLGTAVGVLQAGTASVVVQPSGQASATFTDARSPALNGEFLAYVDTTGIRVVRWATGEQVARVDGPLSKPALNWPDLAYVRAGTGQRLELTDLTTGHTRLIAKAAPTVNLGRPALRSGFIAWHVAAGRKSQIRLAPVDGYRYGRSKLIAASVTGLQVNPSISAPGTSSGSSRPPRPRTCASGRSPAARSARSPRCTARAGSSGPPPSAAGPPTSPAGTRPPERP